MHKIKPYLLNLFFTIPVIIFTISSCASKPNIPYPGRMSENFAKLEQWNPLLASEIRKLPEFQDGITIQEEKALDDFVELYADNPKAFSNTFKQMYQVGKPKVRKYCTPLQALYWLFEDGAFEEARAVLEDYQLIALLDYSWVLGNTEHIFHWKWKTKEAALLYQNCSDNSLKIKIDQFKKENKGATGYIIELAKEYPEKFDYHFNEAKYHKFLTKTQKRWNDFSTVVERLNAPELIDYYEGKSFVYSGYYRTGHPASYIFKKGSGNCDAHVSFTVYCLIKAGYNAWRKSVSNREHVTTFYKNEEGYYILDRAHKRTIAGKSRIRGPFNSVSEIENKYFSTGSKIIGY